MPRLTEALIRKRAEHNDGVLPDLEEVALHQQELEKIEALEACCRHIKILLLQNNIIPKMEGLNKLRELEYLNLALNNISKIEGIDNCESLNKLDLTVNFVDVEDLEESVYNLKANVLLTDLYLTGNPCQNWPGYRAYVVTHLPQVRQLDGNIVIPQERIKARQELPRLQAELEELAKASLRKKAEEAGRPYNEAEYTKESRQEMYLELAEQKEEKDKNERRRMGTEPKEARVVPGIYNQRGEIRQCNEGKFDFFMDDSSEPGKVIFELGVPKYLETSSLDVDVNPLYVRCVVKEKVTQLKLPAEVKPDSSKVQRARITGRLRIEMPLVDPGRVKINPDGSQALPPLEPLKPEGLAAKRAPKKGSVKLQGGLDSLYKDPKKVGKKGSQKLISEVRTTRTSPAPAVDSDDDDVPPLESRS